MKPPRIKPHLYMAYAWNSVSSKKLWNCDGAGIMASGATPKEAYGNWLMCVWGVAA